MNTLRRTFRICAVFTLLTLFAGCSTQPRRTDATDSYAARDQLQGGIAEINITPPVGHRMAGYYDERLATGIHDPLKAKALVFRQGGEQIALVFCDLVGLSLNVTTNARAFASQQTGIAITNIVMAATHSHTGPLFDDVRRRYFHEAALAKYGKDPRETIYYPDFLTERLVKVTRQAQANLAPVLLEAGVTTQEGLPFNRRYHMKNGRVAFNPGQLNTNIVAPAGPVDSDVGMLLLKSPKQDKPFGGLTVFAMHADTVGGSEYSADYPFFIQEKLRSAFGAGYISAFGAGTCGDLNHINVNKKEPFKGFAMAEHLGTNIAETVIRAVPGLDEIEKASLASRSVIVTVPLQQVSPEDLAEAKQNIKRLGDESLDFYAKVRAVKALDLSSRGPTYRAEVQVFRLEADTAIVCLPAEIFVEFGLAIKKASPFKRTLVISICNDRPSYVPTLKAFSEGSYEVVNSRLAPGSGERMVEIAIQLLKELKP